MKHNKKNNKKMTKFHEAEKNEIVKKFGVLLFFVIFCYFPIIFLLFSTIFDDFL